MRWLARIVREPSFITPKGNETHSFPLFVLSINLSRLIQWNFYNNRPHKPAILNFTAHLMHYDLATTPNGDADTIPSGN
jgi:hypothetical protein